MSNLAALERLNHLLTVVFQRMESLQKQVDELTANGTSREVQLPLPPPPPPVDIGKVLSDVRKDRVLFETSMIKQVETLVDKLVKEQLAAAAAASAAASPDDLSDISLGAAGAEVSEAKRKAKK